MRAVTLQRPHCKPTRSSNRTGALSSWKKNRQLQGGAAGGVKVAVRGSLVAVCRVSLALYQSVSSETKVRVPLDDFGCLQDVSFAGNQRVVVDFDSDPKLSDKLVHGVPDGMCIDNEGKLWVACFAGSQVVRFDPNTGTMAHISVKRSHTVEFTIQEMRLCVRVTTLERVFTDWL